MVAAEVTKVTRKRSLPILSRRRDNSFEEDYVSRQTDEPGDRVRNESVILVEIKTNVIVRCSLLTIRFRMIVSKCRS